MRPLRAACRFTAAAVIIASLSLLVACGENVTTTPNVATQSDTPAASNDTPIPTAARLAATATPATLLAGDTPFAPTAAPTLAEPTIELPAEPTSAPTPSELDDDQQATIYSLLTRDLLKVSEADRGGKLPAFVGISPKAGQGELLDTSASGVTISDGLIGMLADLGTTVAFEDFAQAIGPLEDGGKVRDDGVYLTFGPLREDPIGGGYQLYASYYHANDDAAGYSYVIYRENSEWKIKDRQEIWTH